MTKEEIHNKTMVYSIGVEYQINKLTTKGKLGKRGKKYIKEMKYNAKLKDLDIIHREVAPIIRKKRQAEDFLQQSAQKRYIPLFYR